MTIILIRHGKPAQRPRKKFLNRREFNLWLISYDLSGLDRDWVKKNSKKIKNKEQLAVFPVISSHLKRAYDTAEVITGHIISTTERSPLYREVPLIHCKIWKKEALFKFENKIEGLKLEPASIFINSLFGRLRLPLWYWLFTSRLRWFFLKHGNLESKADTLQRIKNAGSNLEELAINNQQVTLCSHGFFLFLLGKELNKRGWKTNKKGYYHYFEQGIFQK